MNKKQLLVFSGAMIITSALVSAGVTLGGLWYMQNAQKISAAETPSFEGFSLPFLFEQETLKNGPSFHALEKIVLSVKGNRQTHFVMLELAVETRHPERIEAIDGYMPMVQNALLKLFANKHYDDLQKDGAVETLQEEVKQTLLLAFAKTDIVRDIDDVLLTKYVVQ
ncbi:flagellar protein [Enterovibrio norvegicus FF-454]|uniref:Flagellar protein FliL n=1 Tax=Enterovibrio norvegicus FF-454 TaxID=1185651 RepID=A0A1E5BYZ8_9GAMM|nr:flagellar basal body-associated FliL family protein [Enterovibrio norvegicus]OEE58429.1 flagellar protein [Enterovibrio norvegicus FF-454]